MSTLSERLQSILDERGWSQRELSRRAHLKSEAHVGLVMSGEIKALSAENMLSIARVAEVELEWLIDGSGPRRRASYEVAEQVPLELRERAAARGYEPVVALEASRARALNGATTRMTPAEIDELLELTNAYLRGAARIGGTVVHDAGTDNPLDDFRPAKTRGKRRR